MLHTQHALGARISQATALGARMCRGTFLFMGQKDNSITMKDENIQPHIFGITASGMKLIALTAMFLDHFAVVYLSDFMLKGDWTQLSVRSDYLSSHEGSMLAIAYSVLRLVGRISFPIYAYLIAEGLSYTSNRMKYSLRLFIFALLSEIPFDIAFHKQWFDFG